MALPSRLVAVAVLAGFLALGGGFVAASAVAESDDELLFDDPSLDDDLFGDIEDDLGGAVDAPEVDSVPDVEETSDAAGIDEPVAEVPDDAENVVADTAVPADAVTDEAAQEEETPEVDPNAEVIMVTANKREESIQQVAVSMAALSGDFVEKSGLTEFKDIQRFVPNLTIEGGTDTRSTSIRIRGIGSVGTNAGIDPSVGLFIDGIYQGRAGMSMGDLFDIEAIEVPARAAGHAVRQEHRGRADHGADAQAELRAVVLQRGHSGQLRRVHDAGRGEHPGGRGQGCDPPRDVPRGARRLGHEPVRRQGRQRQAQVGLHQQVALRHRRRDVAGDRCRLLERALEVLRGRHPLVRR